MRVKLPLIAALFWTLFVFPASSQSTYPEYSVEDAFADALSNSFGMERARIEVDLAAAGLDASRAELRPSVGFSASASYLSNPPEGVAIEAGDLGTVIQPGSTFPLPVPEQRIALVPDAEHSFFRLQTSVSQPLFTWGRLRDGIEVAEAQRDIALEGLRASEREVRRDVTQRYFALRIATLSVGVFAEAQDVLSRIAADRRGAFEAGAATREAVLQAEANLASLKLRRVQAEEGRRAAAAALAFLTGRASAAEPPEYALVSEFRTDPPSETFEEILSITRAESPDIRTILSRVDQALVGLESARASAPWRPSLGLDIGLELSGQRPPLIAANWHDSWDGRLTVSVGVSGTAFDFGRSDARIAEAEAQLRLAQVGAAEAAEGLTLRLRALYEAVRTGSVAVESADASLALAEERLRGAEVSYRNDLITRSDYLQARVGALVGRLELASAQYDAEIALSELEFVAGVIPSVSRR